MVVVRYNGKWYTTNRSVPMVQNVFLGSDSLKSEILYKRVESTVYVIIDPPRIYDVM